VSLFDDSVPTKCCIYCQQEKPFSEFAKHPTRYDGHDGRCKSCIKERSDLVKHIRRTAPPMSLVCDCCGKEQGGHSNHKKTKLCLDHDPKTNKFRGWLCNQCNTGIGLLGDNHDSLIRAANYLLGKNNESHI
jgi:hypothetical protein